MKISKSLTVLALSISLNCFAAGVSNLDFQEKSADLVSSDITTQQNAYNFFLQNANSNLPSLYSVGKAYYYGYGVKKDRDTAVSILNKAAAQGYATAYTLLGIYYIEEEKDNQKGLEYLVHAVEKKDGEAAYYIGKLYDEGKYVEKNEYYAVSYYSDGARFGNANAQYKIGVKMLKSGDKSNYGKGISYLKKAAGAGHLQSCVELSRLYATSNDFVKDSKRDYIYYLTCAANGGDSESQSILAGYYRTGNIVSQDDNKANYYYNLYASNAVTKEEQKDPSTYYYAAISAMKEKDYEKAIRFFQISADKGNADAYYALGRIYENGLGVRVDYELALDYYKKAKNSGKDIVNDILRVENLKNK